MPIQDYSSDPDLNVQISGINIAEGCPPSGINNAIRQLMADVKVESEAKAEAITAVGEALEAYAEGQAAKDDEQDEAIAGKLDKSGGTMTGNLVLSGYSEGFIRNSSDAVLVSIWSATDWQRGAFLDLNGASRNSTNAGGFVLGAHGFEENYKALRGFPDGTFTWDGDDIITAAGGTMTGNLVLSSAYCKRNTGALTIGIGSDWNDGPSLSLYGVNRSDLPGRFALRSGANAAELVGYPDGLLKWKGSPVLTLVSSGSNSKGWYRKYSDGWTEQGGICSNTNYATVTLPLPMLDSGYTIVLGPNGYDNDAVSRSITDVTKTTFRIKVGYNGSITRNSYWYVCGYGS